MPPTRRASANAEPNECPAGESRLISRGSRLFGYLRPQPSSESLRSTHTAESVAKSWWRGGSLRRRGSNDSLRTEVPHDSGPLQEVDLNRALPPLPSLSNWDATDLRDAEKVHRLDRSAAQVVPRIVTSEGKLAVGRKVDGPGRVLSEREKGTRTTDRSQHVVVRLDLPGTDQISGRPPGGEDASNHHVTSKDIRGRDRGRIKFPTSVSELEMRSTSGPVKEKRGTSLKRQLSKMAATGFGFHRHPKRSLR